MIEVGNAILVGIVIAVIAFIVCKVLDDTACIKPIYPEKPNRTWKKVIEVALEVLGIVKFKMSIRLQSDSAKRVTK